MKYFAALKLKDIITLISFVVLCFVWILVDQIFIKEVSRRFPVFVVLVVVLFFLQYIINKPENIWKYANSLAIILIIVSVALSLIMHCIVNHDFGKVIMHSVVIWLITAVMPYVGGLIYFVGKKKV